MTTPLLGPDGAAPVPVSRRARPGTRWRTARCAPGPVSPMPSNCDGPPGARHAWSGRGGRLGFGLLCLADRFRELRLAPGIDLGDVGGRIEAALATADLVITARAGSTPRPPSARPRRESHGVHRPPGFRASRLAAASPRRASRRWRRLARSRFPSASARNPWRRPSAAGGPARALRRADRAARRCRPAGTGRPSPRRSSRLAPLSCPPPPNRLRLYRLSPTETMATVNIHEAKTHLSRLLERVQHGEQIVIANAGRPVAMLAPLDGTASTSAGARPRRRPRRLRRAAGRCRRVCRVRKRTPGVRRMTRVLLDTKTFLLWIAGRTG